MDEFPNIKESEMKKFVKTGIKKHFIDPKPKRSQLYFLYKLILNRKNFEYKDKDVVLNLIFKKLCLFRK